jgi:Lrp/AsnC family transcriptional regulator for asnA, asnC and gidA
LRECSAAKGTPTMNSISEKEKLVLRALLIGSNRPRKQMAMDIGMSESDFSRTTKGLMDAGIIKKFTIEIDYKKLGYPDVGLFVFSLKDKKYIKEVVRKLREYAEIIEIQEVFGEEHDVIIRIMAENNERIRIISEEISSMEEVNSDAHTFTLIFALNYKREAGVDI